MSKQPSPDDYATFSQVVEDLQVRIAFLDELVDQLNTQIAIQDREITDLKKQMKILYQRFEVSHLTDGVEPFDPNSDRPPHY